jgi:hypothetical protein
MSQERRDTILEALLAELERQSGEARPNAPKLSGRFGDHAYAIDGQVDLLALATAIDGALGGDALTARPVDEGRSPEDLTAENDG